ncbi:MAG: hypothetical protein Q7S13_06035 [Candidatus Omnitrophota bacterium]|uniref:hypothetical protein n=1 Tax=Candidatus Wunengus sp. YC61 TaxID=3367698 RepID=UPI0027250462|nr:hypothetical protein [Candidatus Omnitrophota bacterium]
MAKNKAEHKNEEAKRNPSGIEFPRIPVSELLELTHKVDQEHAGKAPYKEVSKLAGTKGETRGGKFAFIVKALKLYDLMDREGYQEMSVTDFGQKILKASNNEQKRLLFFKFKEIPIFGKIYDKYEDKIPPNRSGVVHFVKNSTKDLDEHTAGRIVGMYYKEFEYFSDIMNNKLGMESDMPTSDKKYLPTGKQEKTTSYSDLSGVVEIIGKVFPQESSNINHDLETLIKISKEKNFIAFSSFLEALQTVTEGKEEDEVKKELKKASEKALAKLKADLTNSVS